MHDIIDIKEGPKYHEDTTLSGRVIIMQSFCFQKQTILVHTTTTVGQFEAKQSQKNARKNMAKNFSTISLY